MGTSNNKRIVKNTLLLYVRMLVTMGVGLYTSRVVLNCLGIEDFGINNVVAGMVTMFTFLNSTLASGTQRFLTFAIGQNDFQKQQLTFSTTFLVHLILAILLCIVTLVIGYLMLVSKLNIPAERMNAAIWVFLCSVITIFLSITQVPYMSSIIAHEDMGIYAYMSIFDAVAKLAVAYLLMTSTFDKLKLYALLLLFVAFVNIILYRIYCMHKYAECHVKLKFDKKLLKSILFFSGWNVMGSSAVMLNNQGFNMLLNIFWGTIMNAARGISMQINGVVMQLVNNFQTAVNPQIVKYYANNEIDKMIRLINNNARYAGLLILFIIIPVSVEIPFLLSVWLGKVPPETIFLTRIVLIQSLLQTLSRPIVMGIHAVGKMKMPNILAGGVLLLILPISYILMKAGISLYTILIVNLIPWLIECLIEIILLNKYIGVSVVRFYRFVYMNVFLIGIFALFPVIVINQLMDQGWWRLITITFVSCIVLSFLVYFWGLNDYMRTIIKSKISEKFSGIFFTK